MSADRIVDPSTLRVRGASAPFSSCGRVPSDKSISHRAVLLGALADGETRVRNPLMSADVRATIRCARALGAEVIEEGADLRIIGASGATRAEGAATGKHEPMVDCGDSGTTARLLLGALAGRSGRITLDGSEALRRRPMARVATSLREMGADIAGERDGLPMTVVGAELVGRAHDLPVASAQWKSAILLAGMTAEGVTTVREPNLSRDHTERMLPLFGVPVVRSGDDASVHGRARLRGAEISVPADPSSAAFLAVASIITGGTFVGEDLLANPTRVGAYAVMERMGATVLEEPIGVVCGEEWSRVTFSGETVDAGGLRGTDITASEFPSLLDEVPILGVLAAHARGRTRFFGVRELRAKESDRIESTARMLRAFGVRVEEEDDVLTVHGGGELQNADVDAEADHRIAMSAAVMAMTISKASRIRSFDSVAQSFPGFAAWLGDRAEPAE